MYSKAVEIFYYKYRTFFDKDKTAKAYGYWEPYAVAEKFFQLVKRATKDDLDSGKIYFALLKSIGVKRSNKCEKLLHRVCTCSMYNISDSEFETQYEKLCTEIQNTSLTMLKDSSIEMLICILSSLGLFRASFLLREKYERKVLDSGSSLQKYSVYFQNGQFGKAYELIQHGISFRILKCFCPGTFKAMERCLLPTVCPDAVDKTGDFARYLQGKRVYIIGPSDNRTPVVIPEENRVVIRYAYMGAERVGGYYKTIPTDISYYNGMHAVTVSTMEKTEFLLDLSFAVLKYRLQNTFWNHLNHKLRVRYADRVPYTMQHGVSPNMLQIVLTDLLPLGKINLMVLDNNLYLNRSYTEGYASNQVQQKMDDFAFANQFAKHDVFCNFKYTRALFLQGYFTADSRLEEILSMTCEQFAEAMEQEYGHMQSVKKTQ